MANERSKEPSKRYNVSIQMPELQVHADLKTLALREGRTIGREIELLIEFRNKWLDEHPEEEIAS